MPVSLTSLRSARARQVVAATAAVAATGVALLTLAPTGDAGPIYSTTVDTIAGNGGTTDVDNVPATQTGLNWPAGIARDSQGNVYIAETWGNRVRKIATNGTITTVVDVPTPGYLAVDSSDRLYVSRPFANEVDRIDAGPVLTKVAGGGNSTANGVAATSAKLNFPVGIAVDTTGKLYIAEQGGNKVRVVNGGTITTVAGTGTCGYGGDAVHGTISPLCQPAGLRLQNNSSLLIADSGNNRVRRLSVGQVQPINNLVTIAGNGSTSFSGDGGPATAASLSGPLDMAVSSTGTIYISDTNHNRIRAVATDGTITTAAGNGIAGYTPDGTKPSAAEMNYPWGIITDASDQVVFADTKNGRVRRITKHYLVPQTFPSLVQQP